MSGHETKAQDDALSQPSESSIHPYASRIVKRTRYGIWDAYEEAEPDGGQITLKERWGAIVEAASDLERALRDLLAIPGCKALISIYTAAELVASFVPAASVWLQGQFLQALEVAATTRSLYVPFIAHICFGKIACILAEVAIRKIKTRAQTRLQLRLRHQSSLLAFIAAARLDIPTSERAEVQESLRRAEYNHFDQTAALTALTMAAGIIGTGIRVGSQAFALMKVLKGKPDAGWMTAATLAVEMLPLLTQYGLLEPRRAFAFATKSKDFFKLQAWVDVVTEKKHRQELVAGDLASFAISEYTGAATRLGDDNVDWNEAVNLNSFLPWGTVNTILQHVPQIVFGIRAARRPEQWAQSLTSLSLVESTAKSFATHVYSVYQQNVALKQILETIRDMYSTGTIENEVPDGTVPFPQDRQEARGGAALEVEFRDVTFKYPGANSYALKNVSFTLLPGQLCVIVGMNGAGKSTILKLIVRLYDPEEGSIFIGGHDIRTLKLSDLRQAVSVLFQDYTHFPFSIRDNIALGDPWGPGDDSSVRLAAQLGGATEFIEKLEDGFDTRLDTPDVGRVYGPPEGSKTASGTVFDTCAVRAAAGLKKRTKASNLSGGQMQRLAVSRSFMRSVVRPDTKVGLLLFDEPSAALDPIAEHDLFDRLRELRGNKTMVFSSHRFGKLTRHADIILYMDSSGVVESGSHDELLGRDGEYARLWGVQAKEFI